MDIEDFFEAEVAAAVAATAALFSPKVRGFLRRGVVYGVAGALMAGDAITGFARGVARGAQQAAASASAGAKEAAGAPPQGAQEAVSSTEPEAQHTAEGATRTRKTRGGEA